MTGEQLSTLVKRARDQDGNAISQLYEEYHNGVYFLCLKIVKNEDDALDLVQDSFLQAFNKLDTLQNPVQFRSWLNQIAANKCRDYLKKKKPLLFSQQQSGNDDEEENEPEIEDRDESLVPDKALDTEETRRLVMEIIDGLPDLQRMTVMLYYYEEKSIKEIAEMMECSENTVKSRLNYARKQIREGVLDLEKKGTKLYGVMPMLFPIIRHAASDFTLPSGVSSAVLGNITTSLAAGPAQGTASNIAAKAAGAARKAVTGFSKLSLPARIGAGVAAAAVVVGIGLGVSAAIRRSVPVQAAPKPTPISSTVSSMPSSSGAASSESSVASSSAVSDVPSSAIASSSVSSSRTVSSKGSASSPTSSAKAVSSTANVPITSIKLSRENWQTLPVYMGETEKLTVTVTPEVPAGKVVWSSSNPKIATVDQNGNVKGVSEGHCSITASGGSVSAAVGVWVKPEFEYMVGGDHNSVSNSGNVISIQYDKIDIGSTINGSLRLFRNIKSSVSSTDPPDSFICKEVGNDTIYKFSNSNVIKMTTAATKKYYYLVLGRGTVKVTMSCPESPNSLTVTINVV